MKIEFKLAGFWLAIIALASFAGFLLTSYTPWTIGILLGVLALVLFAFLTSENIIVFVLIPLLALGSYYRTGIAEDTYYLRFFFLGLIAIRGVLKFYNARTHTQSIRITPWTFIHWMLFLTIVMAMISSINSLSPVLTIERAVSLLLFYFVIFVFYWLLADNESRCRKYASILCHGAAFIFGVGIVFLIVTPDNMFLVGRLRLILWNPNQLGHYCALMIPLAIWNFFENSYTKTEKLYSSTLVIVILVSLVWTGCRGAVFSAAVGLLVQFVLCYRGKLTLLIFGTCLVLLIHALMGDLSTPSITEEPSVIEQKLVRRETLSTASGRTEVWKVAWQYIQKRPGFGYGYGVVDYMFRHGYFPVEGFHGSTTHNSYIDSLISLGWIGSIPLFSGMIYLFFFGVTSLFSPTRQTDSYRLSGALYSVAVIGTLGCIGESWLLSVGSIHAFPFWFSVMLLLKNTKAQRDW